MNAQNLELVLMTLGELPWTLADFVVANLATIASGTVAVSLWSSTQRTTLSREMQATKRSRRKAIQAADSIRTELLKSATVARKMTYPKPEVIHVLRFEVVAQRMYAERVLADVYANLEARDAWKTTQLLTILMIFEAKLVNWERDKTGAIAMDLLLVVEAGEMALHDIEVYDSRVQNPPI